MDLATKTKKMKVMKIFAHPFLIIISFCLMIISGEHLGGFYLSYLLLALPHGGIHSLFAFVGIVLLLISYNKLRDKKAAKVKSIMNIAGLLLMILSLFFFFYNDKEHYNYGTFYQFVPQVSLIIFQLYLFAF